MPRRRSEGSIKTERSVMGCGGGGASSCPQGNKPLVSVRGLVCVLGSYNAVISKEDCTARSKLLSLNPQGRTIRTVITVRGSSLIPIPIECSISQHLPHKPTSRSLFQMKQQKLVFIWYLRLGKPMG